MRRPLAALLPALLLLAGCAKPPEGPSPVPTPAPPPVESPSNPQPPGALPGSLSIETAHGGLLVRAVTESYLWFAGGRRLALTTASGLWSIRPDGGEAILLAPSGPGRTLLAPFGDGVVYLERQPGALVAFIARPGQPPLQVGEIRQAGIEQPGFPFWASVNGSRLTVLVEGLRPVSLDLTTGKSVDLGDEPIPVWRGELVLSPGQRHLAYKVNNRADPVRILDLESGAIFRPSDDRHVAGVAWSPVTAQWAVRAAEPGADLPVEVGANLLDGGTHLDLGDTRGGLTHLKPPRSLELVDGPWWSTDGKWLAVLSGRLPRVGEPQPEPARTIWVVSVAEGEWRRLGTLPAGAFVTGFSPDGFHVQLFHEQAMLLWPIAGGSPIRTAIPWLQAPGSSARSAQNDLYFLSAEPQPQLYRQPAGGDPKPILREGTAMGGLTVGEAHLAVVIYRSDMSLDLLVLPLPR